MRIFLLANNIVGLQVLEYLKTLGENIVALGVHEPDKQKYTPEIIRKSGLDSAHIFTAKSLRDPAVITKIRGMDPDIIISAFWGYILKPDIIRIPRRGVINFHPGYLPYNRGLNPNVWPFVDGSPAGVTLHMIDEGIDTGPVLARKIIPLDPTDTAETLYDKTLIEIVFLFREKWPDIRSGKIKPIPQSDLENNSSAHTLADIRGIDRIDLDRTYTGRELINLLRARTYSGRYFAYYEDGGKIIRIRVQLAAAE